MNDLNNHKHWLEIMRFCEFKTIDEERVLKLEKGNILCSYTFVGHRCTFKWCPLRISEQERVKNMKKCNACDKPAEIKCINYDIAPDGKCIDRIEFFCSDCAIKYGYCLNCGRFYGGREFTHLDGYCETCAVEIKADSEECDED